MSAGDVGRADGIRQVIDECLGVYETNICRLHEAMLEAGEYIISEFFGGDYERAINPRNAVKVE